MYTLEQVEGIAANIGAQEIVAAQMLRAYAATLRQSPAQGGVAEAMDALRTIADWKLPDTGETWPSGGPISYEAQYGSNGARDYMRNVARNALTALSAAPAAQGENGMQPSRPKPRMPISPLGIEDFCFCDNTVSLQSVSGWGAPEGYPGKVRLKINGEFVTYVREGAAPPAQPAERVPEEAFEEVGKWWVRMDGSKYEVSLSEAEGWNHCLSYLQSLAATPAAPADGDGKEGVR